MRHYPRRFSLTTPATPSSTMISQIVRKGFMCASTNKTPCYNYKNTNVGKVNNLHVLAFDKQTGLLANFVAADQEMMLTTEHETLLPLQQGDYELVAWTGNAAELASAKLQKRSHSQK